jgi:hypothetical protein
MRSTGRIDCGKRESTSVKAGMAREYLGGVGFLQVLENEAVR